MKRGHNVSVLSQAEADTLQTIEKALTNPKQVHLPPPNGTKIHAVYYLRDNHRKDDMKLSTYHAQKNQKKVSYRILYNSSILLVRVDTQDATPHINPDKKIIIPPYQPHIHIYREWYGDKFAYPLPNEFKDTDDIVQLFMDFLSYSNIINIDEVQINNIQEVLFYDS